MTVHVDTSVLIHALTGTFAGIDALERAIARGDELRITTLVLYEWRRGRRTEEELSLQETFFGSAAAIAFGVREADTAARLYTTVRDARHRGLDIAIAACALEHDAALWTLNRDDFIDLPDLTLYEP
ncbi:MAG: type II toxin-antitoxin system VapC family toxin [Vicinamibacterales bacterium]